MITTNKVAEFTNLLRKAINSDSNLTDEFAVPLSTLLKDMMDGEGGGGTPTTVLLEPSDDFTLVKSGEEVEIGDTVTMKEIFEEQVAFSKVDGNTTMHPYRFFKNNTLEEAIIHATPESEIDLQSAFQYCEKLKKLTLIYPSELSGSYIKLKWVCKSCPALEEVVFSGIVKGQTTTESFFGCDNLYKVTFTDLEDGISLPFKNTNVKLGIFPKLLSTANILYQSNVEYGYFPVVNAGNSVDFNNIPSLKATVLPAANMVKYQDTGYGTAFGNQMPNFYYVRLLDTINADLNISLWNPTNALSNENTDLIEWREWDLEADGETPIDCTQFQNNKEKFLYCFRNLTLPAFENPDNNQRTLIMSAGMYDVLSQEQDIMEYFINHNWNVQKA